MTRAEAWTEEADYVVVGSGAGGATAAVDLARAGADVLVIEEGGFYRKDDFGPDLFSGLANLWRDFGGQVAVGRSVFPVAQGRCVGGSTVINGAVMHRLPRSTWEAWCADPGLREAIPWESLERAGESVADELGLTRNLAPRLADLPLTRTLESLGWEHQAMMRAAEGCRATLRCTTGCPSGGKRSMENSLIPAALERGARLVTDCRVERVLRDGARATGVEGRVRDGRRRRRVRYRARHAVLVAAGTIHSPLLLGRSGVRSAHLGHHLVCHMGSNVVAEFDRPVREIEGPTLGYEVFPAPGIKLSSIPVTPSEIALGNVPVVGRELVELLARRDHLAVWNDSVRCESEGRVSGRLGLPRIRIQPGPADVERVREAAFHLTTMLFAAGARTVFPGIFGIPRRLEEPAEAEQVRRAPLDPRSYAFNVSHIFGTCRMASRPEHGVVDPRFRVHGTPNLHVVDASVFPSNIGPNPQLAVMTLARHATQEILACA